MAKRLNIFFPCIGRRVALAEAFRKGADELGIRIRLIGADSSATSPALHICDKQHVVTPISHPRYRKLMQDIIRQERIDLVVPTIDLDLPLWADLREPLLADGCHVLVSAPKVVELSQDKRKTFRFLRKHGFDTPETVGVRTVLKRRRHHFPYFLKPWDGHASRGNVAVHDLASLRYWAGRIPHCIAQEFVDGEEYTVDVLTDFDMQVRCVVPRLRIQTRCGEVSKARTVKHPGIINLCRELTEQLQAGPGVVTIQCFLTKDGKIKIIEINPRFGGGIPLSIQAGAEISKWILQWCLGQNPRVRLDGWQDGLIMSRYDAAVWMTEKDLQQ